MNRRIVSSSILVAFTSLFIAARALADDTAPPVDDAAVAQLQTLSSAFAKISEAVKPSVVHIKAVSINKAVNRELRRMLGEENYRPMPTTGTGSGIILDDDGYICTNNHVIADARKVYVTLADGRKFTAQVIGKDPKTDLAVLRIHADNLKPARLGNSEQTRVGEIVLAIGSPFRLGHSVSHGIVSAIGRSDDSIDVDIAYKNWIQTDAPINPGNSGGPLINVRGEVIGLNVAIATETGGHQGVGFAIPANTVSRIAAVLRSGEKIVRGFLGVTIKPVDDRVADAYGLHESMGAFIEGVGDDSPAKTAGLRAEDIVLAVDGRSVKSQADLQELIATLTPGKTVPVTVWRQGKKNDLSVTVGSQPDGFSTRATLRSFRGDPHVADDSDEDNDDEALTNGRFGDLGFEAESVTPALAKKYELDADSAVGAMITQVDPTSEAWDAGLRPKQVVTRANDKPVKSVKDLQELLTKETLAKGVRLRYRADGEDGFTVLRIR